MMLGQARARKGTSPQMLSLLEMVLTWKQDHSLMPPHRCYNDKVIDCTTAMRASIALTSLVCLTHTGAAGDDGSGGHEDDEEHDSDGNDDDDAEDLFACAKDLAGMGPDPDDAHWLKMFRTQPGQAPQDMVLQHTHSTVCSVGRLSADTGWLCWSRVRETS